MHWKIDHSPNHPLASVLFVCFLMFTTCNWNLWSQWKWNDSVHKSAASHIRYQAPPCSTDQRSGRCEVEVKWVREELETGSMVKDIQHDWLVGEGDWMSSYTKGRLVVQEWYLPNKKDIYAVMWRNLKTTILLIMNLKWCHIQYGTAINCFPNEQMC